VILDVQLNDSTEIGINWDLLTADRPNAVYRQNFSSSRLGSTIESADTLGNATAFNTTGLGGDFSVISGTVRQVLHMIQQKKNAEILASPSTLVVSGRSATIKAVEEIPYRALIDTGTGGQDALSTTQFKEVGINLQVTAVVADSNNIFLTVDTEQNVRTGQSTDGVPVVDTRGATTSLVLGDGQIVIIGGLRRQEKTKEVKQVPILGDLPILGNLFKSTSTATYNSELVVLLSPHIDKGGPLPPPIAGKYHAAHDQALLSGGDADSARSAGTPVGTGGQRAVED
jgi:type II secretory pathway component GspD/PulD (secretin)